MNVDTVDKHPPTPVATAETKESLHVSPYCANPFSYASAPMYTKQPSKFAMSVKKGNCGHLGLPNESTYLVNAPSGAKPMATKSCHSPTMLSHAKIPIPTPADSK